MLSQVARAFKRKVVLATHTKDMLEYTDSFLGREGVDALASIMKTTDRNLSLLIGRCLDVQGFFHDVTYLHKLRDSVVEVYKFERDENIDISDTQHLPNGVFTLLTDCYSPTCTRDRLCYSVTCPRRLEQNANALWSTSVPKEVLESVSDKEKTRQEVIFEIIQSEREFVEDLETTIRVFMRPLRERDIIHADRREKFTRDLFLNIAELHAINSKLLRKLIARQKENLIVEKIGDIFINIADEFYPYVEYGAKQIYAKNLLDEEKASNPELLKFLKECERLPELRKLPLESFLARPTTRMGRYPLLLKPVMEKAVENHPDRTLIPQAMASIKEVLSSINSEAGKAENIVKLSRLEKQIIFGEGQQAELRLNEEGRTIVRDGKLTVKRPTNDVEMTVFLFDHMFLVTRKRENGTYKIAKNPIPLELLVIRHEKTIIRPSDGLPGYPAGPMLTKGTSFSGPSMKPSVTQRGQVSSVVQNSAIVDASARTFPITITHLGRSGGQYTLFAASQADRQAWYDAIEKQKLALTERKKKFTTTTLVNNGFHISNRINCLLVYGDRLILGTDVGLFIGTEHAAGQLESSGQLGGRFVKVVDLERVTQIDILPNYDMLLVLADKNLLSFPMQILDFTEAEASSSSRKGKKIGSQVSFFKQGVCTERTVVCAVKSTALTATIKVLEPVGLGVSNLKGKIGKLFRGTSDSLRVYKEFYIPTESRSIHYLKSKLCVGCAKGFELVDLESLNTQGLLDPSDETLEFVLKKDSVRPISIFKIRDGEFLLCYNEFGFYVDRYGRRAKVDWIVNWSGFPMFFSYQAPYILAYDPSFIEVRHVDTGELQQIIPANNLRSLSIHPDSLYCVMDLPNDFQQVFRLQPYDGFRP
eukprot:jgi/Hompol1/1265/HPOL_002670-RA